MDYKALEKDLVTILDTAHNPSIARIRGHFFEAENSFFRENIRDENVLVLGSGLGHDAFELIKYNSQVIGFEILENLVVEADYRKRHYHPDANVHFAKCDFVDEGKSMGTRSYYNDISVLNMGTFGNFENKIDVLNSITKLAPVTYLDFYLPGEENTLLRKRMYEEEGYKDVKIKGDTVYTDYGFSSEAMSKDKFTEIFSQVVNINPYVNKFELKFTDFHKFATMATIYRSYGK